MSGADELWDWYHGASPRPMTFTETITTGGAPSEVVSFTVPERITRPLEEAELLALRSVEAMMARFAERAEARAVINPASPKRRVSAFWPNP